MKSIAKRGDKSEQLREVRQTYKSEPAGSCTVHNAQCTQTTRAPKQSGKAARYTRSVLAKNMVTNFRAAQRRNITILLSQSLKRPFQFELGTSEPLRMRLLSSGLACAFCAFRLRVTILASGRRFHLASWPQSGHSTPTDSERPPLRTIGVCFGLVAEKCASRAGGREREREIGKVEANLERDNEQRKHSSIAGPLFNVAGACKQWANGRQICPHACPKEGGKKAS